MLRPQQMLKRTLERSRRKLWYEPIRVEDVQADDVIRPENLPPNVPAKDFWSLLAVADSAGFVEQLNLRATGFF